MENGFLESPLDDVRVQRGSGLAEEEGQANPMPQEVSHRRAQAGVRLHLPLLELGLKPGVQFLHDRFAVFLVKPQPLLRR